MCHDHGRLCESAGLGGKVSLAAYVEKHRKAIEYDLLTRTGRSLDDVGNSLSWDALAAFIEGLGADSALMRDLHPDVAQWSTTLKTNAILADIFDCLAQINANLIAIGSHKKAKKTKPYPRPGKKDKNIKQIGNKESAVSVSKFERWLERMRKSMADHIEVAQAYVTIIPSMQGAQKTIADELGAPAESAGKDAGKKLGSSMTSSIGDSLSKAGSSLTKGLTVPLVAAGTAAVAAWKQVDEGLDIIVQKTGASGDALDDMGKIMERIATDIPVGFNDAGAAVGEVNTRFGATGEELEKLSKQFIMFAQLNGTDVSGSVDAVSKSLAAFGMEGNQAGDMLDALNTIGQQTGVSVDTLAQQLSQNAAQFQQMGLSAFDAANMLGQADMAGLDASTMLMGLKTAMKTASKDGQTLDQAIAGFTETMQGNGSEADKLALAYELFGSRAGGAIYNAVSTGQMSLDSFNGSLTDFGGSVESTFNQTLNPLDKFHAVLTKLELLGARIVEAAAPVIDQIVATVIPIIDNLVAAWNALDPGMQQFIITAALAAAAIGPIISAVSGVISGISTLGSIISACNPVVLAIVAAVGAVIAIVKNWGAITEWFSGVWEKVVYFVQGLAGAMKIFLEGIWNGIKSVTTTVWNAISSFFTGIWEGLKGAVTNAANAIGNAVSTVWNSITGWTSKAWDTVKSTVIGVWESIKNAFSSAWQTMTNIGKNIVEGIWNGISGAFTWIKNKISGWVGDVLGFFKKILGIHSPSKVFEDSVGKFIGLGVSEGIEDTIPDVEASMNAMADSITPTFSVSGDMDAPSVGGRGVVINVYGYEGQNVESLAQIVMDKIQFAIDRREGAFA